MSDIKGNDIPETSSCSIYSLAMEAAGANPLLYVSPSKEDTDKAQLERGLQVLSARGRSFICGNCEKLIFWREGSWRHFPTFKIECHAYPVAVPSLKPNASLPEATQFFYSIDQDPERPLSFHEPYVAKPEDAKAWGSQSTPVLGGVTAVLEIHSPLSEPLADTDESSGA